MPFARSVPRFRVLVGGKEDLCQECRGALLIGERVYCGECRPLAKRRAVVYLAARTLAPTPGSVA